MIDLYCAALIFGILAAGLLQLKDRSSEDFQKSLQLYRTERNFYHERDERFYLAPRRDS
jgi:hypothetical protein